MFLDILYSKRLMSACRKYYDIYCICKRTIFKMGPKTSTADCCLHKAYIKVKLSSAECKRLEGKYVKTMHIFDAFLTVSVLQHRPLADEEIDGKVYWVYCVIQMWLHQTQNQKQSIFIDFVLYWTDIFFWFVYISRFTL